MLKHFGDADDSNFNIILMNVQVVLKVSGDAFLILIMEPMVGSNLQGEWLSSGHLRDQSSNNLVERRFLINPNAPLPAGRPTENAKLDVTATYKVDTFCSPLMSDAVVFQRRIIA